jgi:hypothetical protein
MSKTVATLALVVFTSLACGGTSEPAGSPGTSSACTPTECGPEPPIAPSACPPDKVVTSVCERGSDGKCGRRLQCNDKH